MHESNGSIISNHSTSFYTASQLKILILGAGILQHPAIMTAKQKGYWVIVADANVHATGVALADEFWNIDLKDTAKLIEQSKTSAIDGVLTCGTDFSYSVACIADACSLPGISPQSARISNYKHEMRKVLSKKGVPVPQYMILHVPGEITPHSSIDIQQGGGEHDNVSDASTISCQGIESLLSHVESAFEYQYPLVVKPVDNMGSRGVNIITNRESIVENVNYAKTFSRSNTVVIETYLEGKELSIDSFIQDGILYPLGIADRHIHFNPYFVETGHDIPSTLPIALQAEACQVLSQAASAAGITQGICKGDIIFHRERAYIGEFAARLSGGYMSGWTIPYSSESSNLLTPTEIAIDIACGHRISTDSYISHTSQKRKRPLLYKFPSRVSSPANSCKERGLLGVPGRLTNIQIDSNLYSNTLFRNLFLNVQIGDYITLPCNNTQKLGSVIMSGKEEALSNTATATMLSQILFDVDPNEEANNFLFSSHDSQSNYTIWRNYPNATLELEMKNRHYLTEYLSQRSHTDILPLPIWIPKEGIDYSMIGIWTHCTILELLGVLYTQNKIVEVTREENSTGGLVWAAILNGGWQGFNYLLQLIQICPDILYTL